MVSQTPTEYGLRPNMLTIPELEQSKAAVLNTLASVHSRRSYTFAIDRFIAWYCSEPRLSSIELWSSGTGRTLKDSVCPPLRSIRIFQRFGNWRTSPRKAAG